MVLQIWKTYELSSLMINRIKIVTNNLAREENLIKKLIVNSSYEFVTKTKSQRLFISEKIQTIFVAA